MSVAKPEMIENGRASFVLIVAALLLARSLVSRLYHWFIQIPPILYDKFITDMTEVWYDAVFSKVSDGERLLDVGIGTAGALIRNRDSVKLKKLHITGIDYNSMYVDKANAEIRNYNLENLVRVECMSVYDRDAILNLLNSAETATTSKRDKFDSAYFSGSISLMPDPVDAILSVATVVKPQGKIYITQTFQKQSAVGNFIARLVKPYIKLFTTIDFGKLITTSEILQIYNRTGLKLLEHDIIPSSVDNIFQSAYLSALEVQ